MSHLTTVKKRELCARLGQVPLFAALGEESLKAIVDRCRRRCFLANETLFHEGDPGYTLYVILSGQVSIQRWNEHGQVIPIARRGPGEHIGELSLLDGAARSADAVTTEPSELLMLDSDGFQSVLASNPPMAGALLSTLARRLREAADALDAHRTQDIPARLCSYLLELVKTRGQVQSDGSIKLVPAISQATIADQISSTRESVNRALSRLREVGVLHSEGRYIRLTDMKRLRAWAGE